VNWTGCGGTIDGLIQDFILSLNWSNWGKPQETWDRTASPWAQIWNRDLANIKSATHLTVILVIHA